MNRCQGAFLLLLVPIFLYAAPVSAAETSRQTAIPALVDSPVPFFHTYNLTSLFPVGRVPDEEKKQGEENEVLTVDDCIKAALENNPAYGKVRENMRAAVAQILTAWGNYIPTVSSSFNLSQNNRTSSFVDPSGVLRTSGGISKSTGGGLSANLTLFDAASHYFDMKNAHYFEKERSQRLTSSEISLVDQVRRAYFDALRQQQLLTAAQNQAQSRRDQLRLAEARFSVGSVTRLDVLQAQVDVRDQELVILQYENALKNTKMALNQLMGSQLARDFNLVDKFPLVEVIYKVEDLVSEALQQHPDVKALDLQIKQQENVLWMGRLAYLPTISTSLSYSRSADGLELIPNQDKGRGLSVRMSWNIWDSFGRFSRNRNTEIQLNNLLFDRVSLQLSIERYVRQYYLDLTRLYERNRVLAESRELRRQSLDLEQERYRLGASSILELRQSQVDYAQAESNYINSVYDYHTALSTLSNSVGRDLMTAH